MAARSRNHKSPALLEIKKAELAKQLQNPVASLISVPFQSNFDFNMGPNDDGFRYTLNFQPVIPVSLGKDFNLIIRTIVPIISQDDVIPGTSQSGLGDIVQSFFFSPKKPVGGLILGFGPVFLYPSATDDLLGSEKWGAGPTGLVLKQSGGWTYGLLFNHIWSYGGADDRAYVSSMMPSLRLALWEMQSSSSRPPVLLSSNGDAVIKDNDASSWLYRLDTPKSKGSASTNELWKI